MDSLPLEIINIILNKTDPKDYTNFILAYDRALELWLDETIRKIYKEQFIEHVITDYQDYYIRIDTGKYHGKYTQYYYNTKKLMNTIDYIDGKKHGRDIKYHDNICYDYGYINDKINGKCMTYYADSNQLMTVYTYVNDKYHGKHMYYNKNGKILFDIDYLEDSYDGKYLEYYNNGNLKLDFNYRCHAPNGLCLTYHYNGGLNISEYYINGLLYGERIVYHKYGEIELRQEYVNNILINTTQY